MTTHSAASCASCSPGGATCGDSGPIRFPPERWSALAGLAEAPCQFAAFADIATQTGHGLGRATMPEMTEYSVVAALSMMWLAARAEGIGMGWVSILEPSRMNHILDVPATWRLIGYFCLGYPLTESDVPELERAGWEHRREAWTAIVLR